MSSPPYNGDPRDECPHLSVSEIAREAVRSLDVGSPLNPHVRCKGSGDPACPNCYPMFGEMRKLLATSENQRVADLLAKWAKKNKPIDKHTIVELECDSTRGGVLALPLVDIKRIRKTEATTVGGGKLPKQCIITLSADKTFVTKMDYDQLVDMWEAAREDANFEEPRFVGSLLAFAKGEIRRVRAAEGELHVFGSDNIVIAPGVTSEHPDFDALWTWLGEYGWLQA